MRKLIHRPSPAMALSFVALLAALSGTAIALPGKNSVQSNDIKSNAVTSSKIKKNAVRSSDVKNDSLTGSDVNESTLAKVPSAGAADTAAAANTANSANTAKSAGVSAETARLRTWHTATLAEGAPAVTVFTLGGVTITAQCVAAGANTVLEYNANGGATDFAAGANENLEGEDADFPGTLNDAADDLAAGAPNQIDPEDGGWQAASGALRASGQLAGYADADIAPSGACVAWGTALIS